MSDRDDFLASYLEPTRRRVILGGLGALAAATPFGRAAAQNKKIIIENGEVAPTPIAIPSFLPGGPGDTEVANGLAQVIANNLTRSGMFTAVDPSAFPEHIADIDTAPQFDGWRTAKAQALVVGQAKKQDDGQVQVGFRLWDIETGQDIVDRSFSSPPQNWRRIAHIISDQIYTRMTGEQGYFD